MSHDPLSRFITAVDTLSDALKARQYMNPTVQFRVKNDLDRRFDLYIQSSVPELLDDNNADYNERYRNRYYSASDPDEVFAKLHRAMDTDWPDEKSRRATRFTKSMAALAEQAEKMSVDLDLPEYHNVAEVLREHLRSNLLERVDPDGVPF